jgi:hypothetical protein
VLTSYRGFPKKITKKLKLKLKKNVLRAVKTRAGLFSGPQGVYYWNLRALS